MHTLCFWLYSSIQARVDGHFPNKWLSRVLLELYLAGPDPGDQIPIIPEDIEYFQDPSGVAEYRDAGVGDGEI